MLGYMTEPAATLGKTDVLVPRMGVGAMTWGDPSGRARWTPAKLAYGGGPRTATKNSWHSTPASPPARRSSTPPRCTAPARQSAGSVSWPTGGTS